MFLLDTCTLLWLASDQGRLSSTAKETLGDAQGKLFVSAITGLEIAIKMRRDKLILPLPASQWFPAVCEHHGIVEITVDGQAAALSGELPVIHLDPFDRIIAATAIINKLKIISPDKKLEKYPGVEIIW